MLGRVYKIICYETDNVYIGSTTKSLTKRLKQHERVHNNNMEYISSSEIIKGSNYEIELIEEVYFDERKELTDVEGYYQRFYEDRCVNKIINGRTKQEYNNKKVTCICGETSTNAHIRRHERTDRHQDIMDYPDKYYKCECSHMVLLERKSSHVKTKTHQKNMKLFHMFE
jgi:hypothetical protein